MSTIKISKVAPFGLRLLPKLKEALDAVAEANGRSLNAEITERLEWSLAAEEDFAAYRANVDHRSTLAARRLLNIRGTGDLDPAEARLQALEEDVAALKTKLGLAST